MIEQVFFLEFRVRYELAVQPVWLVNFKTQTDIAHVPHFPLKAQVQFPITSR
jgi:hypothetical protein